MVRAAGRATALGYSRPAMVVGGVAALAEIPEDAKFDLELRVPYIGRDSLAALMNTPAEVRVARVCVGALKLACCGLLVLRRLVAAAASKDWWITPLELTCV